MAVIQLKSENQARSQNVREERVPFLAVNLAGISVMIPAHTAIVQQSVRKIVMTYIAPAAIVGDPRGVTLMLGTLADPAKFAAWITEATKASGQIVVIPANTASNILSLNEILTLRSGKGKTKAGVVNVEVYLGELR